MVFLYHLFTLVGINNEFVYIEWIFIPLRTFLNSLNQF
jgi:hypothetical protein